MKHKLTQLERIRGRLLERGFVTRNECLQYFIENTGRDYIYHLVSTNGAPFQSPAARARMLKDNDKLLAFFDSYQPEQTKV